MSNTAELIVRCRQSLTRIEEKTARGVDEVAAFEIAAFAGLAQQLRWAAEVELEERNQALAHRELMAQERVTEGV